MNKIWLLAIVYITALIHINAQTDTSSVAAPLDSSTTVSLVTFYPGDESFAIYGHTEIRIQQFGQDYYYNYGVFDFNSPGFIYRFVTGDAMYYCVPIPAKYARTGMEGRRMVEQRLNLTQSQAERVRNYLIVNSLPDNRAYQYRYLTDNCSTRPRDIIENALDDDSLHYGEAPRNTTYRKMMTHYGKNYPWQQFGIDLVLGSKLDKPLDYRQQMFVPMVLMEAFDGATLMRDGQWVPLVSETDVVVDGSEEGIVLPPTPWWRTPLAVSIAILILAIILTVRDVKRRRVTLWFDTAFFAMLGIIGCMIAFLITMSHHEALSPNYNLLWAHPLALIAAILTPLKHTQRILRLYHGLNAVVMVLTLAGWYFLPQAANMAFFPLMLTSLLRSISFILSTRTLER
ncbi:MAG: DUF4105 domain-containing protein [Muribaculaceae bacterium]|nr:DUF4105 domain-containing protein [Muribaculaceae bacterium]